MTDTTALTPFSGESPFDQIREIREDGTEFWSGRKLQKATGYARWEDFAKIIERAIASARNSGHDIATSFSAITEKPSSGGRPRQDYQLSRFGAYLTVMNGDPNMPEVAAAQAYFAIRTREAETRPALPDLSALGPDALAYLGQLSQGMQLALESAKANQAKADAYDAFLNGKGCYLINTVANLIGSGHKTLWNLLYQERILIERGSRRRQPRSIPKTKGWFTVKTHDQSKTNGHASSTTYVTPYGLEQIRQLAIDHGLIAPPLLALTSSSAKAVKA